MCESTPRAARYGESSGDERLEARAHAARPRCERRDLVALRDVLAFGLLSPTSRNSVASLAFSSALAVNNMGATQRATLAVLAATLGGLATRNSFVSEQREEH